MFSGVSGLYARTPKGRNEQRKYISDTLRVAAIAFLVGPVLDFLRLTDGGTVFTPTAAIISAVSDLMMITFGILLLWHVELEE